MELSPETCRVKPLRRINAIVASCWNYFTIITGDRSLRKDTIPEFVQRNLRKHKVTRINFKTGEFYISSTALPAHRPAHQVHDDDDDHDKYDDDHVHVMSYLTSRMRLNGLKTNVGKNHLKMLVSPSTMNFNVM